MSPRVTRVICTVALGYSLALLPEVCGADDKDPKSVTPSTDKAPDFSKYTFVADAFGEVVKADDGSLTLRVTWFTQQGAKAQRPHITQHNRHPVRPPAAAKVKEEHHDYVMSFVTDTQIRTRTLPPKTDDKGKKVDYTTKEIQDAKGKWSVPGYSASASDLVPGTLVEVYIIRDKTIAADKVTDADYKVKYAIISGKDPNPPKDITTPPEKKTKN